MCGCGGMCECIYVHACLGVGVSVSVYYKDRACNLKYVLFRRSSQVHLVGLSNSRLLLLFYYTLKNIHYNIINDSRRTQLRFRELKSSIQFNPLSLLLEVQPVVVVVSPSP